MAIAPGLEKYDLARKRISQQGAKELDSSKDALARRFAQLGSFNSGARMKIEQQAEDEASRRLADANEGINAQESEELFRRNELDNQRKFQTSERLGTEKFYAGESDLQRKFQTGERLGSQEYGTKEREGYQAYTSGEAEKERISRSGLLDKELASRADLAGKEISSREGMFDKEIKLKKDAFDESKRQFEKSFGEDVRVTDFNMKLAEKMMNEKDALEKLMGGSGGIPGIGGVAGGISSGNKAVDYIVNPVGNITSDVLSFANKTLKRWKGK